MATQGITGLFSAGDLASAENQDMRDRAMAVAKLGKGEAGAYTAGLGSGMLIEGLAEMAGMKTRAQKKQEDVQAILSKYSTADQNDPKVLFALSQDFIQAGYPQLSQSFAERARTLSDTLADNAINKQEADARTKTAEASSVNAMQNRPTIEVGNPDNPQQTIRMQLVNGKYEVMLDSKGNPYIEDKFTSQLAGNLSEDYQAVVNDNGIVIGAEPIPGSPADLLEKSNENALAFKKQYEIVNVSRQLENIDKVIGLYNNRITNKKLGWIDINGDTIFSTAAKAFSLSGVPGTPRANMDEALAPIIANIGFDKLQAMREASPTGGALGQVSNIELAALQKSLASLSLNQTAEEFYSSVLKVQRHYQNMIKLMSADGSEEIEDLKLDNKYEVTKDESTGEVIVTLVPREEDEPAF